MSDPDRSAVIDTTGLAAGDLESSYRADHALHPSLQLKRPICNLPLAAIQTHSPAQTRQEAFNPESCDADAELLASIRAHGVLEPVMVQRTGPPGLDSTYRLVFGHRRCTAAGQAGLTHVPALLAHPDDPVDLLTLAENIGTRPLSAYERALALEHLQQHAPDRSLRTLARQTGLSPSTVSNLLRAYRDSTPRLRALFAAGQDARAVVELQPLFQRLPEDQQADLASRLPGFSRARTRRMLDQLAQGIPLARAVLEEGDQASSRSPSADPDPSRPAQPTPDPPDPQDEQAVTALASRTGASPEQVGVILSAAERQHSSLIAVQLLCLVYARGGVRQPPSAAQLRTAEAAVADATSHRLVQEYLRLRQRLHRHLATLPDGPTRSLLQHALGGS